MSSVCNTYLIPSLIVILELWMYEMNTYVNWLDTYYLGKYWSQIDWSSLISIWLTGFNYVFPGYRACVFSTIYNILRTHCVRKILFTSKLNFLYQSLLIPTQKKKICMLVKTFLINRQFQGRCTENNIGNFKGCEIGLRYITTFLVEHCRKIW